VDDGQTDGQGATIGVAPRRAA